MKRMHEGLFEIAGRITGKRTVGLKQPTESPSPGSKPMGGNARVAQESAELLNEVFTVIFGQPPSNRAEFGALLNSMIQGASLEGIYNGLTHSSGYRRLEAGSGGAAPGALKVFTEMVAEFQGELPKPTLFDASSAQPLEYIAGPEGGAGGPRKKVISPPSPGPVSPERLATIFVGASTFTLKRVAGDEALKVLALKRRSKDQLATWFGAWASKMAARGVDFGLPLRNKAEERFHFDTAFKMPEDRLTWEVLNRVHRVLNAAESRR